MLGNIFRMPVSNGNQYNKKKLFYFFLCVSLLWFENFIHILLKNNNLSKKKTSRLKARCFSHPDNKQEEEDDITVNIKE